MKKDSLYKPVQRKKAVFNKLELPKSLVKALPFKSQPKDELKRVEGTNKECGSLYRVSI